MTRKENLLLCKSHYEKMRGCIDHIEIHLKNGEKHGIGNPDAVNAILETMLKEIDRQIVNC